MHSALAALVAAAPLVLGASASASAGHGSATAGSTPVFRFADPAIIESSALVVQDRLFYTLNDSGDSGRVFAVDGAGTTVGVTHWSAHPTDCEALAAGGPGYVWVGDIGDNLANRSSVSIARVPVGRGDRNVTATSYRLTYPHGHTDAETLVRNPVTGRLYIASKNIFGGGLYAVPKQLSATGTNKLTVVGNILAEATDGSFFPDGRHLILRNYTSAVVYAWPSMKVVGSFELPRERQGEGISVAADGSVYLSTEGAHTPVLRITLPPAVRRTLAATGPSSSPSQGPANDSSPASPHDPSSQDLWPWAGGGLLALLALVVLVRALRPR